MLKQACVPCAVAIMAGGLLFATTNFRMFGRLPCCVVTLITLLVILSSGDVFARAPYRPALALESITLPVPDLQTAVQFYRQGLGLRKVESSQGAVVLESSLGSALRLMESEQPLAATRLHFQTDSLAAVGLALKNRGVPTRLEHGADGMKLVASDPFGNTLVVTANFPGALQVPFHRTTAAGSGELLGSVTLHFGPFGMVLVPSLQGLSPGRHSIHVHEFGSCGPADDDAGRTVPGLAAGGHYQPADAAWMGSPVGEGTLGDLPDLFAEADGSVAGPVVAPEVRYQDVVGRAIMIHARSDNMMATDGAMDHSMHMMDANPRMACGLVPD